MTRTLTAGIVLAGLAGFAFGWIFLFPPRPDHNPDPEEPESLVEFTHRYPLLPADMQSDRDPPVVVIDSKGRALVAWSSQTGENERTLFLVRSDDEGYTFDKPVAFRKVPTYKRTSTSKGKEMTHATTAQPRLAVNGDTIHLAWTEAIDGGPKIEFRVATTKDGGKTFTDPATVSSTEAARPNFPGLSVGGDGAVVASWLDARNHAQQPFATVSKDGKFARDQPLLSTADGVCPCCDTDVVRTADGTTFVAFRNVLTGNRDIFLSRAKPSEELKFEAPVPVSEQHWKFDGCPHDGPSLALAGDRLHIAWTDASTGKRRVYLTSTPTGDLAFQPRSLGYSESAGEQGHPKVAAVKSSLYAVWDEALPGKSEAPAKEEKGHSHGPDLSGSGRTIMFTRTDEAGEKFETPQAIASKDGVFQMRPSLAVSASRTVLVTWAEMSEEGKNVVVVRLAKPGGSCCDAGAPRKITLPCCEN